MVSRDGGSVGSGQWAVGSAEDRGISWQWTVGSGQCGGSGDRCYCGHGVAAVRRVKKETGATDRADDAEGRRGTEGASEW